MKKRITLGALTRVEYTAVIEVPDDATEPELQALADEVYGLVDGSEYNDDEYFWERGETVISDLGSDPPADYEANRNAEYANGWELGSAKEGP